MKNSDHAGLRTWIEIDTGAIDHNYRLFRGLIGPGVKLMAIAKSNAYGHSLHDYAEYAESIGADWIGVDALVEAVALRARGVRAPILVLGYTLPEKFIEGAEQGISITISSFESLRAMKRQAGALLLLKQRLRIHLKVDTGMHRQGFFPEDVPRVLKVFSSGGSSFILEGVYTHLAGKDPFTLDENRAQLAEFEKIKAIGVTLQSPPSASLPIFPS